MLWKEEAPNMSSIVWKWLLTLRAIKIPLFQTLFSVMFDVSVDESDRFNTREFLASI